MRRSAGRLVAALGGLGAMLACSPEPEGILTPELPPGNPPPPLPRLVVVNTLSETLSSLNLETGELTVQAELVGTWANRITARPGAAEFLVAASGDNAVEAHDVRDLTLRFSIDLGPGSNPWVAAAFSASRALVTNWLSSDVRKLDLSRSRAGPPLATSPGPEGFAVAGDTAYVACTNYQGSTSTFGEGKLDIVELSTWRVVGSVTVGRNPQDVLVDGAGRVHVLCTGTYGSGENPERGSVHVVDPKTLETVGVVALGGSPGRLARGDGSTIWSAGFEGGVRRYDASTLELLADPTDPALAAGGLSAIAWDAAAGILYVTSFEADLLIAVDGTDTTVRQAWIVGDGPVDLLVYRPPAGS